MEFNAINLVNKSRRITFVCLELKLPLHLDINSFLGYETVKTEAMRSSEKHVNVHQSIWHNIPDDLGVLLGVALRAFVVNDEFTNRVFPRCFQDKHALSPRADMLIFVVLKTGRGMFVTLR